jgi:chromosome segregation ATPase
MWQDYLLAISGALIFILVGIIAYGAREKNEKLKTLESKLSTLDRAFAIKIEWFSNFEKKLDTYFKKMDDVVSKNSKIESEYDQISGAAKMIDHAMASFNNIIDGVKTEALDVMKETRALTVTNKKRQVILEKQVSKICDKLEIKYEYDPDIFIDYDVFKKFKGE